MSIDVAMRELARSPGLVEHLAHLGQIIRNEGGRREQFHRTLREDVRAEFIHGPVVSHDSRSKLPARVAQA